MEYGLGIPTRGPLANRASIEAATTCAGTPTLLPARDLRSLHRAARRRLPPSLHRHRRIPGLGETRHHANADIE